MLTKRNNPKSDGEFFALSNPEDGCCGGPALAPCSYIGTFDDDIDEITSISYIEDGVTKVITVGVAVDAADVNSIYAAIKNALTSAEPGGGGFIYHDGDIKVYFDSFTDGQPTIEILSEMAITDIVINSGGDTITMDQNCAGAIYCLYRIDYTYDEDLTLVIENNNLGTLNESDADDIMDAINTAMDTAGYTTSAVWTRDGAVAGHGDVWLWLPIGVESVYKNGGKVYRTKCELKYFT